LLKIELHTVKLPCFALIIFFGLSWLPSSIASPYLVQDAGLPRWLALAPGSQSEVIEVNEDGTFLAGPFQAFPRVTVGLSRLVAVEALADSLGATGWRKGAIGGFYLLDFESVEAALAAAEMLYEQGYRAEATVARPMSKRFTSLPDDPLFPHQWHLQNSGQNRGLVGIDINVVPAWESVRGRDIYVGVCDGGVQIGHPDLAANSFPLDSDPATSMHKNFQNQELDPNPTPDEHGYLDAHGTAVAGNVAAVSNTIGSVGVAPKATLAGIVYAEDPLADEPCAQMLSWRHDILHIHNNSWGPPDDGMTTAGPGLQSRAALEQGTTFDRDERGVVYTWAGGNGRKERDDSNFDGYANSIYTIAVGVISDRALQGTNGETGANLVVVAPASSTRRQGQTTTDLMDTDGYNRNGRNDGLVIPRRNYPDLDYTNDFGDTSGATPLVSGVVALMLEANPELGWRDVQEILIRTARKISPRDRDWRQNPVSGFWFNHKFGAGMVDAAAAVNLARDWTNLPAATSIDAEQDGLELPVTSLRRGGATVTFDLSDRPALRVEHVEFGVSLQSARNGVLGYLLTAPSGMVSYVPPRPRDRSADFGPWTFMSVRHWGESSVGTWTVRAITSSPRFPATLTAAMIRVHGTPLL
jgi:subtilisin family serine protease